MIMAKIRLQKTIAWLNILIFFMIFMGNAEGLVLCFGADGHIEVEATFNGVNCGPPTFSTSKAFEYYTSIENNILCKAPCSSCKDIPLNLEGLTKKPHTTRTGVITVKTPITPLVSFLKSIFTGIVTKSLYCEQSTDINNPLTLIHSTVLLI